MGSVMRRRSKREEVENAGDDEKEWLINIGGEVVETHAQTVVNSNCY